MERSVIASAEAKHLGFSFAFSALAFSKLDGALIRIERRHRALPRLVVRWLMEYDALRFQFFVEPIDVVGG